MSRKISMKPIALAISAALAAGTTSIAGADASPFSMANLTTGYMVDLDPEKKGDEGKCGEGKSGEKKGEEGKCGEKKGEEGKCGEGKCGEGKCGGDESKDKGEEGKCGGHG